MIQKAIKNQPKDKRKKRIYSRKLPKGWEKVFFDTLRECANVRHSADTAKISVPTVYKYKNSNKKIILDGVEISFLDAWENALDEAVQVLEMEARRRALRGVKKPIFQGGMLCGHEIKYSDTLLIFLLKAHKPHFYRERVDHTVQVDGKIVLNDFVKSFSDGEDNGNDCDDGSGR